MNENGIRIGIIVTNTVMTTKCIKYFGNVIRIMAWELYSPDDTPKPNTARILVIGCLAVVLILIFGGFFA